MCRNIRVLFNFAPPATDEEVQAAALQYVRKVSGTAKPSAKNAEALEPIKDADNIVKARVMGWDVVVKKGEFAPGDLCVFFEIDCLLPEGRGWAEFMRPRGFRVKTAKLRGVLSQGLALPVSILGD